MEVEMEKVIELINYCFGFLINKVRCTLILDPPLRWVFYCVLMIIQCIFAALKGESESII